MQDGFWKVFRTKQNLTNKLTHRLPLDQASEWPVSWPQNKKKNCDLFHIDLKNSIPARGIIRCVSTCYLSASSRSRIPCSYRSASEDTCVWTDWCPETMVEQIRYLVTQLWHDPNQGWSLLLCFPFKSLRKRRKTQFEPSAVLYPWSNRKGYRVTDRSYYRKSVSRK